MLTRGQPKRLYEEVFDIGKVQECYQKVLSEYNEFSNRRMDLVLFSFALEHLLIISRVLKQPGGNALLVGVGGSGRQSLTRLAAITNEFKIV